MFQYDATIYQPVSAADGTGKSSLCGNEKYMLNNTSYSFDVFPLIC